jgi:excinuclease ABC subunit A
MEKNGNAARLADSIETALKLGLGVVLISILDGQELLFSERCVVARLAPRY